MIDEDLIHDEKEWSQRLYNDEKDALDSGAVVDSAIPSSYGMLGKAALSIGICNLELGEGDVQSYFGEAAHHFTAKVDAVEEYRDGVEGSLRWNRPVHSYEALRAAILANESDAIDAAIERALSTDHEEALDEQPSISHVLYHTMGVANYLTGDRARAYDWVARLKDSDHDYQKYDGLERSLQSVLDRDGAAFTPAIETILEAHHEEYGPKPDTAVGFLSLDGFCYLKLGAKVGLEVDRSALDNVLTQYLPNTEFVERS